MTLTRDRFTWMVYFVITAIIYLQSIIGPSMPFLREELNLSYAAGGLHISSFAVGIIMIGLFGDRLVRRLGRMGVKHLMVITFGLGVLLLITGQHVGVTITGTLVMGLSASMLVITLQSALVDHHGEARSVALTEMNTFVVLSAIVAPLMIGNLERIGLGWRAAPVIGLVVLALLAYYYRREPIPDKPIFPEAPENLQEKPLPPVFWVYWVALLLGLGVDWCVGTWSADFLHSDVGLPVETASASVSIFFVAMLVGRGVASYFTRRYDPGLLLIYSIGLALLGFPLFWLATLPLLNLLGLFITGLGIANFFSLGFASGINTAPRHADLANARMSLAGGIAVLVAPQLLGFMADQVGMKTAFGFLIVLMTLMLFTTVIAYRMSIRRVVLRKIA